MRNLDKRGTLQPNDTRTELRGKSGRLYGYIDPQRMVIEVKRKGEPAEEIDLKQYLSKAAL